MYSFRIRKRRGGHDEQVALPGSVVTIDERDEYILRFSAPCNPQVRESVAYLGGEMLSPDTAMLGFLNFVGETELAGVRLRVTSTKIGDAGVSGLLQEVSDLASALVFAHGSPTLLGAKGARQTLGPIPYHQLQIIRRSMLVESPGKRLQDWLAIIERTPVRKIERERPVLPVDRVQRLDQRAVAAIFQRLERLAPVPSTSSLSSNPLAIALTFGAPPMPHFPQDVATPRGTLSLDTPENRFVRHVVASCLGLVYRFVDHPKLHPRLRADCRTMLSLLEEVSSQPFLREAGRMSSLVTPTQALTKIDGYRDLLEFWMRIQDHAALPSDPEETLRMLEGRDVAQLYEYWVFLKVLEAIVAVTGKEPHRPPSIIRDELGESLVVDVPTLVGDSISLRYNPTFSRAKGSAYSTPLRPDVVLSASGSLIAFDAKYRLDLLPSDEHDTDDAVGTYKRADLYKMHTYRDAIHALKAAFVVYPGSEFKFFDRTRGAISSPWLLHQPDGVGVIPLRPSAHKNAATLRTTIEKLLVA